MSLRRYKISVDAELTFAQIVELAEEEITGKEEAAGQTVTQLRGLCEVRSVTLSYTGAAAGTEVTVEDVVTGDTLLSVTGKTAKTYRPVIAANAAVGGAESKITELPLIAERVRVLVESADPGTSVNTFLVVREG